MIPPPPRSTLFPYTTLFRSHPPRPGRHPHPDPRPVADRRPRHRPRPGRSEEHTSELQSLRHLVCRLLLEKKKKKKIKKKRAEHSNIKEPNDAHRPNRGRDRY